MTTYKELAQTIKQAADRIVELETKSASQEKESSVNSLIAAMKDKGLIDEKAAGEKKKELLKSDEAEIIVYKKAVELAGSRPLQIATPSTKSASVNAESQLDNWVMGG
mgnify:FL=1